MGGIVGCRKNSDTFFNRTFYSTGKDMRSKNLAAYKGIIQVRDVLNAFKIHVCELLFARRKIHVVSLYI